MSITVSNNPDEIGVAYDRINTDKARQGERPIDYAAIFALIKKNPVFHLATCDGDQPRTRILTTYRADKDGIIFILGKNKGVHKQLLKNPKVEFCYYDQNEGAMLRIAGKLEMVEDDNLKHEIVEKFKYLRPIKDRMSIDVFAVWRLPGGTGSAVLWYLKQTQEVKRPFPL